MSSIGRWVYRAAIVFLAIYTMFAQPGLPACWLEAEPCEFHMHLSKEQAESPHSHTYLIDQIQGVASAALSIMTPAATLIYLMQLSGMGLLNRPYQQAPTAGGWLAVIDPPPPRLSFSRISSTRG